MAEQRLSTVLCGAATADAAFDIKLSQIGYKTRAAAAAAAAAAGVSAVRGGTLRGDRRIDENACARMM